MHFLVKGLSIVFLVYVTSFSKGGVLPTVNTWCYSLQYLTTNRNATQADSTLRFWTSHYDILVGGEPRKEIKNYSPGTKVFAYTMATNLTSYNSETNTYSKDLKKLKDWVDTTYKRFGYNNPDSAFETCFMHTKNDTATCTFAIGNTVKIPPYDPKNPKASRIPAAWQRNSDWCMNLSSVVYRTYWNEVLVPIYIDGSDGLYLDVHNYPNSKQTPDKGNVREFATNKEFNDSLEKATASYKNILHSFGKQLAINNCNFDANSNFEFYQSVDYLLREVNLYYYYALNRIKSELSGAIKSATFGTGVFLHHRAGFASIWPKDQYVYFRDRDRIAGLSAYLMAYGNNIYLMSYTGGLSYGLEMDTAGWFDAMACNFGEPLEQYKVWATGIDPSSKSIAYEVLARTFSNALVLIKPRPRSDSECYNDSSLTIHALPGKFRKLKVNGKLDDSVITQIGLRNWEGAILIPDTVKNWKGPYITKTANAIQKSSNRINSNGASISKVFVTSPTFKRITDVSYFNLLGARYTLVNNVSNKPTAGVVIMQRNSNRNIK